jgi:hypothetical protein
MWDWLNGTIGLRARLLGPRGHSGSSARPVRPRTPDLAVEALEPRTVLDATTLLIGTWNVDIADLGYRPDGFETSLAAMGQEDTYAPPQPPDILTVTETRSNAIAGSGNDTEYLTQVLNDAYGPGLYAHGTRDGASSGGGTEGVIYNTQTVQLLDEQTVGVVSSNGPARQELRYLFRPVGFDDGSADFYVYVGHYKAGTTATDINRRNVEAQEVRADADALGAGVPILYTGDFNTSSSDEPAEQTLLAPGNGQVFDPTGRLGQWSDNPDMVDIDTIASTSVDARFDLLWETAPVLSSGGGSGLQDQPATYHTFGIDGSVPLYHPVDDPANDTLADLPNRLDVLYALGHACSDHLPVLQNYQVVPAPGPSPHRKGMAPAPLWLGTLPSAPATLAAPLPDGGVAAASGWLAVNGAGVIESATRLPGRVVVGTDAPRDGSGDQQAGQGLDQGGASADIAELIGRTFLSRWN